MTAEDLMSRLESVRRSGSGWLARCPAHDDRSPSLSIHEGERGVLLRCFAGCALDEIVAAMGLHTSDLFHDDGIPPHERHRPPQTLRPRPFDWRHFAFQVHLKALDLRLRGEAVKAAAKDFDISTWTEVDLDEEWKALNHAQADLDRAGQLDRLVFTLRAHGLKKEREHGPQPQRSAA